MTSCANYNSGGRTPDHDAADAFVALCTAILYTEGACCAAVGGAPHLKESEGRDLGAQDREQLDGDRR